jgi:DinB family
VTNREFHLHCRKNETLAFHRVLNAMPHDRFDYTPHEKSQPAARIVWTLVGESNACAQLIDTGEFTFGAPPELPPAHLIEAFDQAWENLLHKVETMDEATWSRPGRFMLNGQVRREQPTSNFLWLFFFDAIHHRGQLSTYIRPMGGRVPSIYGPSGDDPMMLSASHRKME